MVTFLNLWCVPKSWLFDFPHILDNWPIINVQWSKVGFKMTHLAGWSSMSSIGIKNHVISLLERFPSWDRWPYTPYAMLWPHKFCGSSRGLWLHHACGEGGGRWHGQRRGSDDPWHPWWADGVRGSFLHHPQLVPTWEVKRICLKWFVSPDPNLYRCLGKGGKYM